MKKNTPFIPVFVYFVCLVFLMMSCGQQEPIENKVSKASSKIQTPSIIYLDSLVIEKKRDELDKMFERLVRVTGFNGTVLYAEKGHVILKKAYGFTDVRRSKGELAVDDAFQLASVSKMFTSMAIMILKNEGKLDFDEDIRTYLPDFPYENITPRLLMTHRAGLPRYMSLAQDEWKNKQIPLDNDDMYNLLLKYHPNVYFKPNNGFHYCNSNYAILANIVEVVSGQHFDDFIQERIFKPLGMTNSFVYNMRGDSIVSDYIGKGISGFYHRGRRWSEMENDYLNGVMGDKNVYSTVEDLYKFDQAHDQGTLVPDSLLKMAFSPGSPRHSRRKDNYGFGWRIKNGMDSVVYHFGWWKGFRTFFIRDMRHHKTLIVLTNKDKGSGSVHFWDIIESDTLALGLKTNLQFNQE